MYKKTPGKPLFQAAQAVDTMILLHSLWVFPRSASHAVLFYTTIFFSLFQDGKSFSFMYNFFVVTGHGVTSNGKKITVDSADSNRKKVILQSENVNIVKKIPRQLYILPRDALFSLNARYLYYTAQ